MQERDVGPDVQNHSDDIAVTMIQAETLERRPGLRGEGLCAFHLDGHQAAIGQLGNDVDLMAVVVPVVEQSGGPGAPAGLLLQFKGDELLGQCAVVLAAAENPRLSLGEPARYAESPVSVTETLARTRDPAMRRPCPGRP